MSLPRVDVHPGQVYAGLVGVGMAGHGDEQLAQRTEDIVARARTLMGAS